MDFRQAAALVIFCAVVLLTVVLVLVPVTVHLPASCSRRLRLSSVSISYAMAPVLGTLAMLATGVLDGQSLAAGIVGDEHMKPYGIVILFMALAYMSSALDMTGCFQWVALHLTRMSKGNGLALFILYYALSSVLTIFTSNDVSIMTLTPIIHYFALATGADPIPFLTAEFTAANIWSMLLFVGNPTNIIVAMAYRLGFLEYTKWMGLPTIAAGVATLGVVLLMHWQRIPRQMQLPDMQPNAMLVDKPGAVLGAANILVCLGLLAAAPALRWELWVVTLVCAVLHALYCFIAYVGCKGRWCSTEGSNRGQQQAPQEHQQDAAAAAEAGEAAAPALGTGVAAGVLMNSAGQQLQQQQQQQQMQQQQQQEAHEVELSQVPSQQQQWQQQRPELAPHWGMQAPHPVEQHSELGYSKDIEATGARRRHTQHDSAATAAAAAPLAGAAADWQQSDTGLTAGGGPSASLASRSCSRQQLLSPRQHADSSDAPVSPSSGGGVVCRITLDTGSCCKGQEAPAAGDPHAAGGTGLRPPPPPSFWRAFLVLPWEIVPFVLGMFCVVEGLNANGWVDLIARWLLVGVGGSVWSALFGVGALSVLLANIINNQPMTILMTRVCMSPAFTQPLAAAAAGAGRVASVPLASAFAVVIASNTAANFSVMGALAGIMFVSILQQRGMKSISYMRFSRLMLPAGIVSTLLALVVVGAEFVTWPLQ